MVKSKSTFYLYRMFNIDSRNVKFYIREIFVNVGKIDSKLFGVICDLARPSLRSYLRKLWREVLLYRWINQVSVILKVSLGYFTVAAVASQDIELFMWVIFLNIVINSVGAYVTNYSQDKMRLLRGLFVNRIREFIKNRRFEGYEDIDITDLDFDFVLMIMLGRHSNVWITLIWTVAVWSYAYARYYGRDFAAGLIFFLFVIVAILGIVLLMVYLYSILSKQNMEVLVGDRNSTELGGVQLDTTYRFAKLRKVLVYLGIDKVFVNVYGSVFVLCGLLLFRDGILSTWVNSVFLLYSVVRSIKNTMFYVINELPRAIAVKKKKIGPIINVISHLVPSPINQPGQVSMEYVRFKEIVIEDVTLKSESSELLLNIPSYRFDLSPGLYIVAGDSGKGKSLFLNIIGNKRFPTSGKVSLAGESGKLYEYGDLGYWNVLNVVNYVWIAQKNFANTTAVRLFRSLLYDGEGSMYFDELVKKSGTNGMESGSISKLLSSVNRNFLLDTLAEPGTREEEAVDVVVKKALDSLLFDTNLFREDERHVLTSDVSVLSGGQQARLYTALFLMKSQQVVLLDEGLERTTLGIKGCSGNGISYEFTRDRMISFIAGVLKKSDKTVFLLSQGGSEEIEKIKTVVKDKHLGTILVDEGNITLAD